MPGSLLHFNGVESVFESPYNALRHVCLHMVNRGTGYKTLKLSKARITLSHSMLNWPWQCTIYCFCFARVRRLVSHNLIERYDWLYSRKRVCFVHRQGKKYGQKHETKRLVEFHNHLHALTMVYMFAFTNILISLILLTGYTGVTQTTGFVYS